MLNEGGAEAVHMPQIWRRRPGRSCVGYHPLHVPNTSFCAGCRLAIEVFYFLLYPFYSHILKFCNPNTNPKT